MNNEIFHQGRGLGLIGLVALLAGHAIACAVIEPAPAGGGGETTTGTLSPLVRTLTWQQAPASEIVECHVFKLPNATPIELERIQFTFGAGSHHVHIYRSDEPEPDGVADCTAGLSWPRWRPVVGAQTNPLDWKLPDGLTMPLPPNAQLLVQVHWLNTTQARIDGRINLSFHPARKAGSHVGVMFGINKQVDMQPGTSKRISAYCPLPDGAQIIAMMGHFHTLGLSYSARVRGADQPHDLGREIYRGLDENTLEFEDFVPPIAIGPGQGLDFQCNYFNSKDIPVKWGPDTATQEHCNMAAYYHPAPDDGDGFCIKEASDVGTLTEITAATSMVALGDKTLLTITMAAPVAADTDVDLTSSDPAALAVPARIRIPIHQRSATVMVHGLRPTNAVKVVAKLGTQTTAVPVGVRALMLSELLVRPAAAGSTTTAGPWIEIANTSAVPIDLARYHLSVDGVNPTTLDIPLAGTLPPHGCLVVTGRTAPVMPGQAMMMPGLPDDLIAGVTGPISVGLVESQAGVALDSVALNGTSATETDSAAIGAPVALGPTAPGTSLLRLAGTDWSAAAVPTPGICELRP